MGGCATDFLDSSFSLVQYSGAAKVVEYIILRGINVLMGYSCFVGAVKFDDVVKLRYELVSRRIKFASRRIQFCVAMT